MPYTTEEGGRLNNFAKEPKMYTAEAPSTNQQISYAIQALVALGLIAGLIFVAYSVTSQLS